MSFVTPRTHLDQRGFTLVELVAVIVLLGILTAVAGPSLIDTSRFDERGYIDELASALRQAQRVAIATQCSVRVTTNAAGYTAIQRATAATCNGVTAFTVTVKREDGSPLSGSAPAGVALMPTPTTVQFDQSGNTNAVVLTAGLLSINVAANGRVTVLP
jgi:MSHA pilin protein MshC